MKVKIKMMKNNRLIVPALLVLTFFCAFLVWSYVEKTQDFECRARIKRILSANSSCNRSSVFDVFLSMQNNGEGYLLVSGTYSCLDSDQTWVEGMNKFTFRKEGNYQSLNFNNKSKGLSDIFNVVNYENIKIKITELTNGDYIISSPIETIMLCSKE